MTFARLLIAILFSAALVSPATADQPDEPSVMQHVVGKVVNVRSGPGTKHLVVGKVIRGTSVFVYKRKGQWLAVKYFDGKNEMPQRGWIFGPLLQPISTSFSDTAAS